MTSNIGSQRILDLVNACQGEQVDMEDLEVQPDSCRVDGKPAYPALVGAVKSELGKTMKPEFLNRIDDIVVFEHLSETELSQIATTMIIDITIRVKMERNVDIEVSGELLRKIVKEGSKSALQYGARPMRRAVQRIYENAISDAVVQGFIKDGDSAKFGLEGDADEPALPWYVMVTRDCDDEVLRLEIEDSSRDSEDEPTVPTDSDEAPEESPEPEPEPKDMKAAFP
jgi:ATP-dependent Clp protease ATP-binding subunit ClpC